PTRVRNSLGRAGFTSTSGGLEKAVRGCSAATLPSASCRPPQFLLRLEATRGDAIHDLRAILKALLRRRGFLLPRLPRGAMTRERLSNCRPALTFDLEVGGLHYVVSVGHFADGALAEIFITNGKAGSDSDTAARDSAVVASIALQFGVPLDLLRH